MVIRIVAVKRMMVALLEFRFSVVQAFGFRHRRRSGGLSEQRLVMCCVAG